MIFNILHKNLFLSVKASYTKGQKDLCFISNMNMPGRNIYLQAFLEAISLNHGCREVCVVMAAQDAKIMRRLIHFTSCEMST